MIDKSIESLIHGASISRGITLFEVLKKIGITPSTYYKIVNGNRPKNKVYTKLANYFGMDGTTIYQLPLNEQQRHQLNIELTKGGHSND